MSLSKNQSLSWLRKLGLLSFVLILSLFTVTSTLAAQAPSVDPKTGFYGLQETAKRAGLETQKNIPEIAGIVIGVVLSLIGIFFLALIIYAGILWMTASGNEEQIKKSRGILINAGIGLAIVVAGYAITYFVLTNLLGATGVREGGGGGGGGGGCPPIAPFSVQAKNGMQCCFPEDPGFIPDSC